MNLLAVCMVIIAGAMWAGSGLAAQHFLAHNMHSAMDLTVFRMITTSLIIFLGILIQGSLKRDIAILRRNPLLLVEIFLYGIAIMIMQYAYFAGIGAGNAAVATVIQYICPGIVICWTALRQKKFPGIGEMLAVGFAIIGVFLLVTGGNLNNLSVPAACIYFSLVSALFYAVCAVYPKHLMVTVNNSFLLMFGMLFGGAAGYIINPIADIGAFLAADVLFDMFMIIICGTVVAFICYNAGLAWLSEGQASVTATVEPAISVIASYFLFDTSFGVMQTVGIILVIAAIIMPVAIKENKGNSRYSP